LTEIINGTDTKMCGVINYTANKGQQNRYYT